MASWLVCSTPERMVPVWVLAGDIVLCSWARHFTLTVPLSTQVYKWVPAKCYGEPCNGLASHPGGSRNTPSRFMPWKLGWATWLVCRLYFTLRCLILFSGNARLQQQTLTTIVPSFSTCFISDAVVIIFNPPFGLLNLRR